MENFNMADPVTDFDKNIWFRAYTEGRKACKQTIDDSLPHKPNLKFPRPEANNWTWKQKAAWRDGYSCGYTRYSADANQKWYWDWAVVKWE